MRGYLIDTNKKNARFIETEGGLDAYYSLLDCDCIDIVTRKIGGVEYDIVCDDEGLLVDDPVPSAIDTDGSVALVGSLLFLHHDDNGNLTALTAEDTNNLIGHTRFVIFGGELRKVVTGVDY